MPSSEKMKMKRNKSTEKLAMSLSVLPIVSKRSSNLFQVFANLNTLKSLKALKAVITEPTFGLSSLV
jgi:hypothetical protein